MAFKSWLATNENCDKCGKPMSLEAPGMFISNTTKHDRHVLYVHIDCMQKLIRKAEKEAIQP